jgi:hypothetical protein
MFTQIQGMNKRGDGRHKITPDRTLSGVSMQTQSMKKLINWFEIPALSLDRARAFYKQILGLTLRVEAMGPTTLALHFWGRVWTLAAWCELRQEFRTFRADRIANFKRTGKTFREEAGKGLADYLQVVRTEAHEKAVQKPPKRRSKG